MSRLRKVADGGAYGDHMADELRKVGTQEAGEHPSEAVAHNDDTTTHFPDEVRQPLSK